MPERLVALLIDAGPWLVFAITATETAIFVGLLVPAEATVLLAAFLADRGIFQIEHILAATLAGGLVGDQIGYMLGRFSGRRVSGQGRLARLWKRYERAARTLFSRRSILAITFARFVSFVRTLMPWFAGMSRIPYPRFLFYDLLGVLGWGVGSVALGYLAGESWHLVAEWLGTASAAVILVALLITFVLVRRRRAAAAPPAAGAVDPWVASMLDVADSLAGPLPSPTEAAQPRERRADVFRVGLTGNIASGKSSVAEVWATLGAHVVDADVLAREAVAPGTPSLRAIARSFGPEVVDEGGRLDRAGLRRLVFDDPAARRRLEGIVHPAVARLREEREAALKAEGVGIVVHDIPLLFEVGMEDEFDRVVLVDAPAGVRLRRLVENRDLPESEARAMVEAQMPADRKRQKADVIIENDGSLEELRARAEEVWRRLTSAADASG